MTDKDKKPIRCAYCGKTLTPEEVYRMDVWINHRRVNLPFCDRKHANYRQMGAEG